MAAPLEAGGSGYRYPPQDRVVGPEPVVRVVPRLDLQQPVEALGREDRPRVDAGLGGVEVAPPAVPRPERVEDAAAAVLDGRSRRRVRGEPEGERDERLVDGVEDPVVGRADGRRAPELADLDVEQRRAHE